MEFEKTMTKMTMTYNFFFISILLCLSLAACGSVQLVPDAVMTQLAINRDSAHTAVINLPTETFTPGTPLKIKSAATTTPASSLGQALLFSDDFSDPESGWDIYSDEEVDMGYLDGGYYVTVHKKNWCFVSTIYRTFSDVSIEVDGRIMDGLEENEYGVACRYRDINNFYIFTITSDGYYAGGKFVDNEWSVLGDSEWGFNDNFIHTGTSTNHLKLTCNFDELTWEVNGSILENVFDPDMRTGDVGLYVCAYDTPGVKVLFDNFVVSKP